MKEIILLTSFLFIVLLFTGCLKIQGPIHTSTEEVITYLSDEEYDNVSTISLDNRTKHDYRKFIFKFEVEHSDNFVSREVNFPDDNSWRDSLDSIDDKKRYWSGEGNEQIGEGIVSYERELIIYSKGLNVNELKKALNTIRFEVYLEIEEGHTTKKEYRVGGKIESL